MRVNRIASLLGTVALLGATALGTPIAMAEPLPTEAECRKLENPSKTTNGWCLAVNRRLGNCLACHTIVTKDWPEGFPQGGNVAPPLVAMKARFPDRAVLAEQIYDATIKNDKSTMPPFGRNGMLTDAQIDDIVEFLYGI